MKKKYENILIEVVLYKEDVLLGSPGGDIAEDPFNDLIFP